LKANNEVITNPHHYHSASCFGPSPLLNPQVKHIVQIHVGQKRANAPALNRSLLCLDVPALLQHPSLEPLLKQPHDAPIRHAVLSKFHQPLVVQAVKETANVVVKNPVHLPLHDPNAERVQRLVRTSPGSKPVGKSRKFLFVNATHHCSRGALDNFIFQHQHSERTKLLRIARLGDVCPAHRLRSVRSSFDSLREIQKIALNSLSILSPRLPVHPGGRFSLQPLVGRSKLSYLVNVMQKSREPLSSVPPCCLTYPLKRAGHAYPALSPGHVTLGRL